MTTAQNQHSEKTSRNHVPQGFRYIKWDGVDYNFDLGGGRYDKATQWLHKNKGVVNLIYDPYNRTDDYNRLSIALSMYAQTTTIFNVFNVIEDAKMRTKLLKFAKRERTEKIYISVYPGDGTSIGKPTRFGWQANRPLITYLPEVHEIYPQAFIRNKMIYIEL